MTKHKRCPRCGSWMTALHVAIRKQQNNAGGKEEFRPFAKEATHNPSLIGCADCGYESTAGSDDGVDDGCSSSTSEIKG